MSGILLYKARDLPEQYSEMDVEELDDAFPVWVAPKIKEKFDDPEENREWIYYDLHVSVWQLRDGQRRHVVKVRENSLMLRVTSYPLPDDDPLMKGIDETPWVRTFMVLLKKP